jgi:hypothetical protein
MSNNDDSLMGKRKDAFLRIESGDEESSSDSENESDVVMEVDVSGVSERANVKRRRKETGDCVWRDFDCGGQLIHGSESCYLDENAKTVCFCKPPPKANYAQQFYLMQYVLSKKMHLVQKDILKEWMNFALFLFQTPEFQTVQSVKGTQLKSRMLDILKDVAVNHQRHTPYNDLVRGIQKAINAVTKETAEIKSTKTHFSHMMAPVITLPKRALHEPSKQSDSVCSDYECDMRNTSSSSSSAVFSSPSPHPYTVLTSKHAAQGVRAIGDLEHGIPPPLVIPRKSGGVQLPAGTSRADGLRQNADGWLQKEEMLMRNLVDTENRKLLIDEQRVKNEAKKLENEERMLEMFRASMQSRGEVPVMLNVPVAFNDDGSVRLSHTVVDTNGVTHRVYDV